MNTLDYIIQKFNLNLSRHDELPIEIPNVGRNEFAQLLAELGFNSGVEVGVWKGEFSEILCKANPQLKLSGVDAWDCHAFRPGVKGWTQNQADYEGFYQQAVARMSRYANYRIVRKFSMDALDEFLDESLDFVYVDAGHDFLNCAQDVIGWGKKVRPGGIISGHDYAYFPKEADIHVKECLLGLTRAYGIKPWFILGEYARNPGQIRDKYRSWFWVK
jgi:hypothetical protein